VLQARGEHAFRSDEKLRAWAEAPIETNLPADFFANTPTAFRRDPLRNRSSGDTARLKKNQRACVEQRRRNARRLTRAGLRGDDNGARSSKVLDDLGNE
jgi:hypothetical protein